MKKNKEVNDTGRNFFEKFFEMFKFQFIGGVNAEDFFVKKSSALPKNFEKGFV